MKTDLVLASGSKIRSYLLNKAGFKFITVKSTIDERNIDEINDSEYMAKILAFEKANEVSNRYKNNLIIGCDQILEFENNILHKVNSIEEAKQRIIEFNGKEHFLYSSIVLVKNNIKKWEIVKKTRLKMYKLTFEEIENYIGKISIDIINSLACYQIENLGINLFEEIEGNIYDIMGFPLFELVKYLKNYNYSGLK